jgi:hypothetical protein
MNYFRAQITVSNYSMQFLSHRGSSLGEEKQTRLFSMILRKGVQAVSLGETPTLVYSGAARTQVINLFTRSYRNFWKTNVVQRNEWNAY